MTRGRKPSLERLKIGTSDGKPKRIVAPGHLDDRAKVVYRDLAKALQAQKLWDPTFKHTLAVLADAVSTHEAATAAMKATGRMIRTKDGRVIQNPWLRVARDAGDTIRRICQEYGWTPVSLSRAYRSGPNPGRQGVSLEQEESEDSDLYPFD